jgi:hypothetical protein
VVDLVPAADQPDPARLVLDVVVVAPEMAATVISTVDAAWEGEATGDVVEVEVRPPAGGRRGPVTVAVGG